MQAIGLTFVDWLIIAIYFGFVLGIGFYLRGYTKTEEDFFVAGAVFFFKNRRGEAAK